LLGPRYDFLLHGAQANGVLDVGCADGELAFLFESLGCKVSAVDHPLTNHNHMRGIRALQPLLDSAIDIQEVDLDSQFSLPGACHGLTLFPESLPPRTPFTFWRFWPDNSNIASSAPESPAAFPGSLMPKDRPSPTC
jgi:hypothetical protein